MIDNTKFGPMQKCPYNKSVIVWVSRLGMMVLGTVGLIFLNIWVAVVYLLYSVVFTFWVMPVLHCKYCYYNVKETTMENKNGKTSAVPINLEIFNVRGLSGHSDHKQILNYLSRLKQKPERIIVDHGESSKCVDLSRTLHKIFRTETICPKNLETIRLK